MKNTLDKLKQAPYNLKVEIFDELPSTNAYLVERARGGCGDTLAIAKSQSAGRGRLNRKFSSLNGGLYMSLLLHPDLEAAEILKITPLAAVAAARAIEKLTGVKAGIKWVNDLYVKNQKLAGILTEGSIGADGKLEYAVIGIGVNIENVDFPADVKKIATSLALYTENPPSPVHLGAEIARELLDILHTADYTEALTEYKSRSILKGLTVRVNKYSESYMAEVMDIDDDINLVLKLENGSIEKLSSDEISIVL